MQAGHMVDLSDTREYRDTPQMLERKIKRLCTLIKASKRIIFFTGAGISTSASIPDFRGPMGVWTKEFQGIKAQPLSFVGANPTYSHVAIAKLLSEGRAQFVISQNIDGLHRRSGVPSGQLCELHGNSFIETCIACGDSYLRDFDVTSTSKFGGKRCRPCRQQYGPTCHCTPRVCISLKCKDAGVNLRDSIINFNEKIPDKVLDEAFLAAKSADLCIVMGSSLMVSPASSIPVETRKNGGKIAVINLQKTSVDRKASVRIFGDTDAVMKRVVQLLDIELDLPDHLVNGDETGGHDVEGDEEEEEEAAQESFPEDDQDLDKETRDDNDGDGNGDKGEEEGEEGEEGEKEKEKEEKTMEPKPKNGASKAKGKRRRRRRRSGWY